MRLFLHASFAGLVACIVACGSSEGTSASHGSGGAHQGSGGAGQGSGSGSGSASGGDGGGGGVPACCKIEACPDDKCTICIASSCGSLVVTCNGSSKCDAARGKLVTCVCGAEAAGDAPSELKCISDFAAVDQPATDLASCVQASCASDCL